jgi:hypothetical protein
MDMVMNSGLRLAVMSVATSGLIVLVLAISMLARDGLDAMNWISLPPGHLFPGISSMTGVASAMLLTIIGAVPKFVIFSPLALRCDQ